MKKKLFAIALLTVVGIIACSSCSKKPQPEPQVPEPSCEAGMCPLILDAAVKVDAPTGPQVISHDNWQFTLPDQTWKAIPNSITPYLFVNEEGDRVLFDKEGTSNSYAEYVISNMRALHGNGFAVVSAQQIIINNNKFVQIAAAKGDVIVLGWITVISGSGYFLSCSGEVIPDAGNRVSDMCVSVANTLQIK